MMQKTVFITGASSGFGKEAAKLFNGKGWNVVATMRSPENEKELSVLNNVLVLPLDVTNQQSIDDTVKAGIEKFGSINVLVNNAGYGTIGAFESATKHQIRNQYAVNVFGLMDVTQAVLPHMRANGGGTIINVSSMGGVFALPFGSLYNSSKFAVEGLSESLGHELSTLNIAVKIIEPGGVATNFRNGIELIKTNIPEYQNLLSAFWQRYAKPVEHLAKATAEDVANAIYLAATDGTPQLRYVVGQDAQFYIDAKMKNSDEGFTLLIRDFFIN